MQDQEDIALRERIAVQVASVGWDADLAEKMYRWVKNGKVKLATTNNTKSLVAKPVAEGNNGGTASANKRVYIKRAKYWAKKKRV